MRDHFELQDSLLVGLKGDEQRIMRERLRQARAAQLDQVERPARRRQRDEKGVLQPLDPEQPA